MWLLFPYAPWCRNMRLQNWSIFVINVDTHSIHGASGIRHFYFWLGQKMTKYVSWNWCSETAGFPRIVDLELKAKVAQLQYTEFVSVTYVYNIYIYYTFIYVYLFIHMYTYIYNIYEYIHVYIYICIYIYTCIHIFIYIYTYTVHIYIRNVIYELEVPLTMIDIPNLIGFTSM
jgi:hypothetical protein